MLWNARAHVRKTLLLVAAVAVVASGCGGGGSAATNAPGNTTNPVASQAGGGGGGGTGSLANAAKNLANINSYKFRMEMAGGDWGDLLSMFGSGSGNSFVVTGTVIVKPDKAVEMDMGDFKAIEINGKSYTYALGTWIQDENPSSSMADSMSPEKLYGSYSSLGWKSAGDEQKNGVATTHYTVASSEMKSYSSMLGVKGDADWVVEMWVSKDGAYIVSMAITAKQNGTDAFKYTLDITNINDPANKVEAPSI